MIDDRKLQMEEFQPAPGHYEPQNGDFDKKWMDFDVLTH